MGQKEIKLISGNKIKKFMEESKQYLISAYSIDYISIDEFENRINMIEQSKFIQEIKQAIRDLPLDELAEKETLPQHQLPVKTNILGEKHIDGSVAINEFSRVRSILSATTIDLRTIEKTNSCSDLAIPTYLAEVKIIVPKDMKVINKLNDFLSEVKIHKSVNSSETEKNILSEYQVK